MIRRRIGKRCEGSYVRTVNNVGTPANKLSNRSEVAVGEPFFGIILNTATAVSEGIQDAASKPCAIKNPSEVWPARTTQTQTSAPIGSILPVDRYASDWRTGQAYQDLTCRSLRISLGRVVCPSARPRAPCFLAGAFGRPRCTAKSFGSR